MSQKFARYGKEVRWEPNGCVSGASRKAEAGWVTVKDILTVVVAIIVAAVAVVAFIWALPYIPAM